MAPQRPFPSAPTSTMPSSCGRLIAVRHRDANPNQPLPRAVCSGRSNEREGEPGMPMRTSPAIRVLLAVGSLLLACACASPMPTTNMPLASPWGSSVPTADPAAIASQAIVAQGDGYVTLLPISPRGATIGIRYTYTTPPCGTFGAIDVDGSFWDVVAASPENVDFGGQLGTFELDAATGATFRGATGAVVELVRHEGAKQFQLCS